MSTTAPLLPLSLKGVSVVRGRKEVLKTVSYQFNAEPRRTLIVGPNGAGKSLLLHICHGVVAPDSGQVNWSGESVKQSLIQRQAMVFQRPVMLRRTAEANVAFPLRLRGLPKDEIRSRVDLALRQTGLARLASRAARSLSFGEQQRLAVARAIACQPEVLFLDEPTASLDPSAAHIVEALVNELADQGVRIIMTSHDLNQARRLSDEVIFMHRGRIKEAAPSLRFFEQPQNDLAAAFLRGELLWWERPDADGDGVDGSGDCQRQL